MDLARALQQSISDLNNVRNFERAFADVVKAWKKYAMEEQWVFSEIGAKSAEPAQEQGHAPEIPPELSESVSWLASRWAG